MTPDALRGARIAAARRVKRLAVGEVAAQVGITPAYLREIENGTKRSSYRVFLALIAVLDLPTEAWIVEPPVVNRAA
jgi:transcriptional regulator with XRE-family HTH domain